METKKQDKSEAEKIGKSNLILRMLIDFTANGLWSTILSAKMSHLNESI